jgi:hypothetical protein
MGTQKRGRCVGWGRTVYTYKKRKILREASRVCEKGVFWRRRGRD